MDLRVGPQSCIVGKVENTVRPGGGRGKVEHKSLLHQAE
jgi:hypothetical protein